MIFIAIMPALMFVTGLPSTLVSDSDAAGTDASACPSVKSAQIVSRVGSSGTPDAQPKYAKAGEIVTLYAVVVGETNGIESVYTDAPEFHDSRPVSRWPSNCPNDVRWVKVEAMDEYYSQRGNRPPAYIMYQETTWASGWAVWADVHPTLMHDEFENVISGYGVMRYKVIFKSGRTTVVSPGEECRTDGAACDGIHRVSFRPDDTYLGYLHELYNTPYIYGSGPIDGGEQPDLLIGSDCSDFVIYGKRREHPEKRHRYWYANTSRLCKFPVDCFDVVLRDDGFYVTKKGKRLVTFGTGKDVRPGDAFNMPKHHVGALARDNGNGYLDHNDLVMHTLVREPETVPLKDCRWDVSSGTIVKWKE